MSKGMITPWGNAQDVEQVGRGIKFVSTASHGGYKVNKEQNQQIPELFRVVDGWYEEDCAAAIVAYFLGETFTEPASNYTLMAADTLMRWYPHEWQEYNGIPRQFTELCWDCSKGNCAYALGMVSNG